MWNVLTAFLKPVSEQTFQILQKSLRIMFSKDVLEDVSRRTGTFRSVFVSLSF